MKKLAENIFITLQDSLELLNANELIKIDLNKLCFYAKINKCGINKVRFFLDSENTELHSGIKTQIIAKQNKFRKYHDFNKILLIEFNDSQFDVKAI